MWTLAWELCITCGKLLAQEDRKVMSALSITALCSPGPGGFCPPCSSEAGPGHKQELCLPLAWVCEGRSELGHEIWVGRPRSAHRAVSMTTCTQKILGIHFDLLQRVFLIEKIM